MEIRFYIDPDLGQPHIYEHGVSEEEVRQVLMSRGDDFRGRKKSRIKFGQTFNGRYLKATSQTKPLIASLSLPPMTSREKLSRLFAGDNGENQDEKNGNSSKEQETNSATVPTRME
jgi:hypothetical protein